MAKPEPLLPPDLDAFAWLRTLDPGKRARALALLGEQELAAIEAHWRGWAHPGQRPPDEASPASWSTWVLKAGRGFGKTRAGSEWVVEAVDAAEAAAVRSGAPAALEIALVAATLDEARRIMVEGRSGLLAVAGARVRDWNPSLRRLTFTGGAAATLFSGASPEQLRGPEHHLAWCDELAKWEKPGETWDMLQLGLRLGDPATGAGPRVLVTTTPRPGPHLTRIMAEPDTIVTHGTSWANPHTSAAWKRAAAARYAGTRLGLQELEGKLLPDVPGALWSVELLEKCRLIPDESTTFIRPPFIRLVIAVDPPSGDGTCGIIACAKDSAGRGHVLADHSVTARSPEGWSAAVAAAAHAWGGLHPKAPVKVIAESNQGGHMVEAVLRTADPSLRVRPVAARKSKSDRAAPVAILFEAGKVTLHGRFPELEAELCGLIAGGGYDGPGNSPDRADAMVWALTELMLKPEKPEPRVRGFN